MERTKLIQHLDAEIKLLQAAKRILEGHGSYGELRKASTGSLGPRRMSAAARARISAAQKKRWAAVRAGKKK